LLSPRDRCADTHRNLVDAFLYDRFGKIIVGLGGNECAKPTGCRGVIAVTGFVTLLLNHINYFSNLRATLLAAPDRIFTSGVEGSP